MHKNITEFRKRFSVFGVPFMAILLSLSLVLIGVSNAESATHRKRSDAEYDAMYRRAVENLSDEPSYSSPSTIQDGDDVAKAREARKQAQEAAEKAAQAAKDAEKAEKEAIARAERAKKEAAERAARERRQRELDQSDGQAYSIPEGKDIAKKPKLSHQKLSALPPLLEGGSVQTGGDVVDVFFGGRGMPEPFVYFKKSRLIFLFPNTRLGFGSGEFRTMNTTIFTGHQAWQNGPDAVLEIRVNQPLRLNAKKAFTPADEIGYRFVTANYVERQKREAAMPQPKRPAPLKADSGPFSSKIYVNLELRDTELKDLFRMLGGYMKKNVIVDPSVPQAAVTMTMKQVPLSEVFEYLMKTYDIWYHMIGNNTVVVGTREGLSKISDQLDTRTYRTGYGEPKDLAPMLASILKIPVENILVDERLKTLVVTAGAQKHERIVEILQKVDKPGRQVMLHAKIVEFSKTAGKDIDAAVNMIYDNWHFRSISGSMNTGVMRGVSRLPWRLGSDYYTAPDSANGGGFLPTITDPKNVMNGLFREFDAAIKAMEQKGNGEMVASPSVIAIDGMEANISLTEDYPYVSDRNDAGNPSWSTQTVGPQLKLTPHVGRDGIITVKVDIQTGEVIEMMQGSNGEQMPRTSKRSVQTTVRVQNGEPFVVGGLFRDSKTSRIQKVPILGDLPILGTFFRSKGHSRTKTEAVIVVVPYIIETPDVPVESEFVTAW